MKSHKEFFTILFFACITAFVFRNYLVKGQVPFSANLLVSFYQPWASYSWEGYPSGVPNKPIGFDTLRIFYPFRKIEIEQIKHFKFPLWNPYSFSGTPLLADYQSAVFHPLSFLFFILPQIHAWSMIVVLQPFLALFFMYLFLREIGLDSKVSSFGAIAFAFSGFMIANFEESFMSVYSALFLPLVLYAIEKISKKLSILPFSILIFGLLFSILSGWFQMSLYVFIFSFVYALYKWISEQLSRTSLFYIAISYIIAFLIGGIHLIPSFEAYTYSARGTTDAYFLFSGYLMPLRHLITFVAPDFFGNPGAYNYFGTGFYYEKVLFINLPAFIFGLYQLVSFRKNNSSQKFFRLAFLITLSLGFSLPTSWFLLYYLKLPFISTILPSRIFFLSTFCLSVLSALGFASFLKQRDKKALIISTTLIFLTLVGLLVFVLYQRIFYFTPKNLYPVVSLKNLFLPWIVFCLITLVVFFGKRIKNKDVYVFVVLSLLTSLYSVNKYLFFSEQKFVFPKVPVTSKLQKIVNDDRVWSFGKGYIEKNLLSFFAIGSVEGYDSIYISRYGELLATAINHGKYPSDVSRADATLNPVGTNENVFTDFYRTRLLNLLDTKYIIVSKKENPKTFQVENIEPIWDDNTFVILKNKLAYPHAFMTDDYRVRTSNQSILKEMFDPNTDLRRTLILEKVPNRLTKTDVSFVASSTITNYTPDRIDIQTKSNKSAMLFLSDNFFPGWKAYVDGVEYKIYRADYSFRAVVVPSGNHAVRFVYSPRSLFVGIYTTIMGILLYLFFSIRMRIKK